MNPLDARRRLLGRNVYKKTVEGNPAIAQGSLARRYPGITMQGWTEQEQYDGNQLFDASVFDGIERSGVRVSVDNGVITASGMSESAIWIQSANFTEEDFEKFKSGNIYVKNYKTSECNYEVGIYINNATVKEGNSPHPIPDGYLETKPNNVYFFIDIRAGIELKGSCKPMIYQDGDGTWEPYTGGQPSPSPDYPQEIVNAGNYDKGTGKYQYTIKISDSEKSPTKSQTVTLTSDRPLTKWDRLEERDGQWGWVYKSDEYTMTGEEMFYVASESYIGELTSDSYINVNNLQEINGYYGFSNYLKIYVGVWGGKFDGVEGFSYNSTQNSTQIHVRISNEDTGVVAEDTMGKVRDKIKAYCAQRYADGTPFIFWHETSEETFTPLSESEQEQMNELYTFRPTTVLSNDCECNMSLTYKTKKSLEVTT